jgi:enoyl-CoA hydratase
VTGISSRLDDGVLRVQLDRPDKLNAVNTPMLRDLLALLDGTATDTVRAVVLTGAGRAFCSGGDLSGRDTAGSAQAANHVVKAIAALPIPVVAGVHGVASGFGCTLALACDVVVAARSATFQLAFTKVGLMPDGGATSLLSVSIGRQRAARLAFLAEKLSSTEAFEWGMISHVIDDEDYEAELATVVARLAGGPTQSYHWIKRAMAVASLSTLAEVQAVETEGQAFLVSTGDFREGVMAFNERRQPEFQGR